MASASLAQSGSHDVLIVGPGVLGGFMGKLWKDAFPSSNVVGLTNTTLSHARLSALGLQPATKADLPDRKYPYVLFSAPPSGSADYVAEVKDALQRWDGSGSFVFTSSMSVCAAENGETVTEEECPLVAMGKGPSTDRLLAAEEAVLQANGNVLRLVGLYHAQRGAHTYFLKAKEVPRAGSYIVNLLHYEDAAGMAMSILRGDGNGPFKGVPFIGCDNHPIAFQDMIVACNKSGVPSLQGQVTWTLPEAQASKGKKVFNNTSRQLLGGWKPKYDSFEAFMVAGAKDFYNTSGLF